ncbi:hypothetical protein EV356DRAFT_343768 [Viridothelium virens]|uniref:Ribosome quality control complex subunit 2 n=1 Tax=Viridothelium virens TaxID=1048519 RepID=A0A6A6GX48_VIRVR|nr:hypothetical protein EV356DRAFT_343768 [Viridothelium virens]
MKQRFSSLDVQVIAHELSNNLTSLRLSNAYDLSSRIFLLKFHKPDHREQLLIESGFRCHLTSFSRTTATEPSGFISKLRKFLKTRRVTSVSQIGTDRIIELRFSDGQYRLYLEFYAAGNIVLTDAELNVLALLRNVNEGAEHEQVRVGLRYNLTLRQNYAGVPELTQQRVKEGLQKSIDRQSSEEVSGKKAKKRKQNVLRQALAVSLPEFPPMLIDHALHVRKFDPESKPDDVLNSEERLEELLNVLKEAQNVIQEITSREKAKGYIIGKWRQKIYGKRDETGDNNNESERGDVIYDDFHPFKPQQFANDPATVFLEFEGFNNTVDEFFSSIEGQKLESRLQEREDTAKRKIDHARQAHEQRIQGLQQVQEMHVRKAQAIEANLDRVTEATAALNGLIAQGMDWIEIDRLIERERTRNNAVAQMIKLPLKLHENTAAFLLAEYEDDLDEGGDITDSDPSESDEEDANTKKPKTEDRRLAVDIDLALSAWSNARQYYDQKKTAAVKEEKTSQASAKALKSTEAKVAKDLKQGLRQEKEVLRPVRKQFWFEKFIYFISSDGYLVLAGKDAQQSEILYKRYLKKGDVYVHADLEGATSVIILNSASDPTAPISPSTLSQAGTLAVATSSAWDSKAVMSAWWVNADQVSKLASTGDVLVPGIFHIKGEKNYLPPAQLLLGFAVIFQISEESVVNHRRHWVQDGASVAESEKNLANEDGPGDEETLERVEGERDDATEDEDDFPDTEPKNEDDDNFPDTELKAGGDDEDFPDAELKTQSEDDDGEDDSRARPANPLQTNVPESREQDAVEDYIEDENSSQRDEDAQDADVTGDHVHGQDAPSAKRHLSAHQHRLLKKGQIPDHSTPDLSDAESETTSINHSQPNTKSSPASKPLVRGKRGKNKKLTSKYADQDEEDRELALRILGSKAGQDKAREEEAAKQQRQKEAEEAKQRRREQHERAQKEGREREEARIRRLEENALEGGAEDENDDDTARNLTLLNTLTLSPHPADSILAAIPVCAPWSALGRAKYRMKLQPGSVKKGKAVREILGGWMAQAAQRRNMDEKGEDMEKFWPKEVELLKAWKEAEVLGVVPVKNVRVMGNQAASKGNAKAGGKGGGRGGRGSKRAR